MFYNTNIIRTTFPDITLHKSHDQIPVNDQTLIPNDEAMEDEIALDGVTYNLDLFQTEHEAGKGDDSDKESIKSVETETSVFSQGHIKTRSGWIITKPTQYNPGDFKTNLLNCYILLDKDEENNNYSF